MSILLLQIAVSDWDKADVIISAVAAGLLLAVLMFNHHAIGIAGKAVDEARRANDLAKEEMNVRL